MKIENTTDLPKISACMMVKNEEEMLPGCLESIKNVVDEIIVVDTGSEDSTVEIAESYGAEVYHHPWENDFSKHRNQSISYATGDWFLVIDADEKMVSEKINVPKLKNWLSTLTEEVNAVLFLVQDFNKKNELKISWKVSRLFRNKVGVHYGGEVHNQPIVKGKTVDSPLVINHYGYDLSPDKMEKKFKRTYALLQKRIEKDPEDFEAYYYLCNLLLNRNEELESAIDAGIKCVKYQELKDDTNNLYYKIYYNIGMAYLALSDYEESKKWLQQGLQLLPGDIDFHFGLNLLGIKNNDIELIEEHSKKYLENYDFYIEHPLRAGNRFIFSLGEEKFNEVLSNFLSALIALEKIDSLDDALDKYEKNLKQSPNILKLVLENLFTLSLYDEISLLTSKFFDQGMYIPEIIDPWLKHIEADEVISSELEQILKNKILPAREYNLYAHIIKGLLKSGHHPKANKLLQAEERNEIPENIQQPLETLHEIFANGIQNALEKIKASLNLNISDKEYYELAIPLVFEANKPVVLEELLGNYLFLFEKIEGVPEEILFILSIEFLNHNNTEHFLEVTNEIYRQNYQDATIEITSWVDIAKLYDTLFEKYSSVERNFLAARALEIAYEVTENAEYLVKLGGLFFDKNKYDKSLEVYNKALQMGTFDELMLQQMQKIFSKMNNHQGVNQCSKLLREFKKAS